MSQLDLFDPGAQPVAKAIGQAGGRVPQSYSMLVDLIGEEAALRFVLKFRGQVIRFPEREKFFGNSVVVQRVAEEIGDAAAHTLAKHLGYRPFPVPMCHQAVLAARDRQIQAALGRGDTAPQLAAKWGLTERSIWAIAKRPR